MAMVTLRKSFMKVNRCGRKAGSLFLISHQRCLYCCQLSEFGLFGIGSGWEMGKTHRLLGCPHLPTQHDKSEPSGEAEPGLRKPEADKLGQPLHHFITQAKVISHSFAQHVTLDG